MVIGGKQEKPDPEGPNIVDPFTLPDGTAAIPASTLKGMFSSLAEAASNSAMRCLDDTKYSYSVWDPQRRCSSRRNLPSLYAFFKKGRLPELLPFDSSQRSGLSLAEQMFGMVDKKEPAPGDDQPSISLQGRVHFGTAVHQPSADDAGRSPFGPPKKLKILAGPKPPCPALYFSRKGYVPKGELTVNDLPNGRKMYLNHNPAPDRQDYESRCDENDHLKARITPVLPGTRFVFHVDFNNLTRLELGLLCYVLRPAGNFSHKLGMGKPLGLGSVRVDPLAILLVDRGARYGQDDPLTAKRYQTGWQNQNEELNTVLSRSAYARDAEQVETFGEDTKAFGFKAWRDLAFSCLADNDILAAIEKIGAPVTKVPVKYPQLDRAPNPELEHFKWFVKNDRDWHLYLEEISAANPYFTGLRSQ